MSKYGCWNKARPAPDATYVAQEGWKDTYHVGLIKPFKVPVYTAIKASFGTTACQYTQTHASDPQCSGCVHRSKEAA